MQKRSIPGSGFHITGSGNEKIERKCRETNPSFKILLFSLKFFDSFPYPGQLPLGLQQIGEVGIGPFDQSQDALLQRLLITQT